MKNNISLFIIVISLILSSGALFADGHGNGRSNAWHWNHRHHIRDRQYEAHHPILWGPFPAPDRPNRINTAQ